MKKLIALLLIGILAVSLCACSKGTDTPPYAAVIGKWVGENENIPHVLHDNKPSSTKVTLYFYEDKTFKEEVNNTLDGYQEYLGTWEYDGENLTICRTEMTQGTSRASGYNFYADGTPTSHKEIPMVLEQGRNKFGFSTVNPYYGFITMTKVE